MVDSRIAAQESDLRLMELLGNHSIAFARVFTKSDKMGTEALKKSIADHDNVMLETWESLPATFTSSAVNKTGREEILTYVEESMTFFKKSR